MAHLDDMALFVRVVEEGSFTAAARLLGLPKSSVSHRVMQLEQHLAATLLHRSTRSIALTDIGREAFQRFRPLVLEAEQTEMDLRARSTRAAGLVRISATTGFGQMILAPVLCSLMEKEPDLRIELKLTDERINIIEDGIDIAVRMGVLDDTDLITRKLGSVERAICASKAYLDRNGGPETPEDLADHACIVTSAALDRWSFASGKDVTVRWRYAAGNVLAARDAVLAGCGIALLPLFLVREAMAKGLIVKLLPEHLLLPADAAALYPRARNQSLATRVVLDAMAAELGRNAI